MYQLFIDGWGDADAFVTANWLLAVDPMLNGIIACMVQCYFAWRLHVIAGQLWLTILIVSTSIVAGLGGIGTGIGVLWLKNYALLGDLKPIGCIWVIGAMVADIAITCAMSYHLRRRKGGFTVTDNLLDRIVQRKSPWCLRF